MPRPKSTTGSSPSGATSETRSISSQMSIGLDGNANAAFVSRMYDIVQIALVCRQHRAMLLAKMPNSAELYFPFTAMKPGESASGTQQAKLRELFSTLSLRKSNVSESILVDLLRIEIPPNNEYIIRYTFRVEEKCEDTCICNDLKTSVDAYQWLQYEDPPKGFKNLSKLWAVEPVLMLDKILNSPNPKDEVLQEITLTEITKYLSDEVKIGNNPLSTLLVKLNYNNEVLYKLFLEYINYTYPSIYMNNESFQEFLSKTSILNCHYDSKSVLAAFQIDQTKDSNLGYIDFDELLWGMLFIDLDCPHQQLFAAIRASYIFRYYSKNKQFLEYDELLKMSADSEQINYRGAITGTGVQKKGNEHEVETFWKEAGMTMKGKGTGMPYAKFVATAEKLASMVPKSLNLDQILRGSKPLNYYLQNQDILSRGIDLGKDMLDIVRKRENVCPDCVAKEPIKVAEHTVKVFYNGTITEVWNNDKWIPDLKREKDKAKRRASNNLFNEDYFPNVLYEAIANFFDKEVVRSAAMAVKQPLANASKANAVKTNKSSVTWSPKFVQKNTNKIYAMLTEVETMLDKGDEMIKPRSPVAVVTDLAGKLTDLLVIERNISQLLTCIFPIRYVYMLTWNDFQKDGFELILLIVACKCLLPEKYHILLGKNDSKKKGVVKTWLTQQCDHYLGKDTPGSNQMLTALLKLLDKLPKYAMVDDAVFVVPGVEYVGDVAENLRLILVNFEAPANANGNKKKNVNRDAAKGSKTPQAASPSVIVSKISGVNTSSFGVPNSSACYVIFTTTEPMTRKLVYVRTPNDDALIALGREKAMPTQAQNIQRQMVVLVETDKIRPIYLLTGPQE